MTKSDTAKAIAADLGLVDFVHLELFTEDGRVTVVLPFNNWRDRLAVLMDQCEYEGAPIRAWFTNGASLTVAIENADAYYESPGWIVRHDLNCAVPDVGDEHLDAIGPREDCECVACVCARQRKELGPHTFPQGRPRTR